MLSSTVSGRWMYSPPWVEELFAAEVLICGGGR